MYIMLMCAQELAVLALQYSDNVVDVVQRAGRPIRKGHSNCHQAETIPAPDPDIALVC